MMYFREILGVNSARFSRSGPPSFIPLNSIEVEDQYVAAFYVVSHSFGSQSLGLALFTKDGRLLTENGVTLTHGPKYDWANVGSSKLLMKTHTVSIDEEYNIDVYEHFVESGNVNRVKRMNILSLVDTRIQLSDKINQRGNSKFKLNLGMAAKL